jgi:hypothetical protein
VPVVGEILEGQFGIISENVLSVPSVERTALNEGDLSCLVLVRVIVIGMLFEIGARGKKDSITITRTSTSKRKGRRF